MRRARSLSQRRAEEILTVGEGTAEDIVVYLWAHKEYFRSLKGRDPVDFRDSER